MYAEIQPSVGTFAGARGSARDRIFLGDRSAVWAGAALEPRESGRSGQLAFPGNDSGSRGIGAGIFDWRLSAVEEGGVATVLC